MLIWWGMVVAMRFRDRTDAGRQLAAVLGQRTWNRPVVLGLARGGVPVAASVAEALGAPLDVFVARKVGAPGQPELGIGAVAEDSDVVVWSAALEIVGVHPDEAEARAQRERDEVRRRVAAYRAGRPLPDLSGRDVVVVDDGLATGVTAEAALISISAHGPSALVLAVPVGAPDAVARLGFAGVEVVCLHAPPGFRAVGSWYRDFSQTTDDEVRILLTDRSRHRDAPTW